MTANKGYEVMFQRYEKNPILTASDWPYPADSVFNAGATLLKDGTTLLLCRVEDRRGHSHLCAARSKNGVDGWVIDEKPTLLPDPQNYPQELWGIEDPRITFLEETGKYMVAYTAYSKNGPGVALAETVDFKTFKRYGMVMQPDDKDARHASPAHRRELRAHPPPPDRFGGQHLDLLPTGPSKLG